ncbi:succinylglutamate desuccinylase/aspartoacylase family protein [Capilliphycus salinus ALCB114379]|uniref:M14 family zinc carboxypeptidase n=1 Tax=Capilliphycus salinus TaxID=2768948 RepID=UPI0039A49E03
MQPTISKIPLIQLASGDRLFLQVYKFQGAKPGKKAYIQSNLHGAEISGNAVIHQLIADLIKLDETQLIGEIWLVPVCNPVGVNQRAHHFSSGRYNSYDGKDWNRIFWDYEKTDIDIAEFARSQRNLTLTEIQQNYRKQILESFQTLREKSKHPAQIPYSEYYRTLLQSLCLDADYLLDLHSSTNQAIDYLYGFQSREESAKAFLLDYGILMNDYDGDAFDEAFIKPWLALEKHLSEQLGKPVKFDIESWTLELGSGMKMNPESVEKGIRGVKNYLASKNLLKLDNFPLPETQNYPLKLTLKTRVKRYYSPTGGMIQNRVELGKLVKSGETLYEILSFNKTEELPQIIKVKAEVDGIIFDVSTNHTVNQCDYVLAIMEQTST